MSLKTTIVTVEATILSLILALLIAGMIGGRKAESVPCRATISVCLDWANVDSITIPPAVKLQSVPKIPVGKKLIVEGRLYEGGQ